MLIKSLPARLFLTLLLLPASAVAQLDVLSRFSELKFDGTNFGETDVSASTIIPGDPFDFSFAADLIHDTPNGVNAGSYQMSQQDIVSGLLLHTVHQSSCAITAEPGSPLMRHTGDFDVEFTVATDTVVVIDGSLSGSSNIADDPYTSAVLDISSIVGTPDVFNSLFDDFPVITTLSPGNTYRLTVNSRANCSFSVLTNSMMTEVSVEIVPDSDDDGLLDIDDNCIAHANPDQRDSNGDGFGNACDADLNNDCSINFVDLADMKAVFLSDDEDADMNGDGAVNFVDLGALKGLFLDPPGPSGVPNDCD